MQPHLNSERTAIRDHHLLRRLPRIGAHLLDRLHHVHALDDHAEYHVLPIEVWGCRGAEEKLGAVGVGAGVGHGEDAGAGVLVGEALVCEFPPYMDLPPVPLPLEKPPPWHMNPGMTL